MPSVLQDSTSYFQHYPSPDLKYSMDTSAQNVDDLIYRYSSEMDRPTGTPTVGIYAQDGIWDDDESFETRQSISTVTSGADKSGRASKASVKTRSRSATISSVVKEGSESPGGWSWNRRTQEVSVPDLPAPSKEEIKASKSLKKKESKLRLIGKSRRGELTTDANADESFESPPPPPMPETPSTFSAGSPAKSSSNFASPIAYPSPFAANQKTSSPLAENKDTKSMSSWKRGVQKILRSKSSIALREAFSHHSSENAPPIPHLPKPSSTRPLGKPFSSSAPPLPLGESRGINQPNLLSPVDYGNLNSFSRPLGLHPDPFASSLDLTSNNPPRSAFPDDDLPAPTRARLPRHSPSLKDLKNFITPNRPKLSKAKSIADIAGKAKAPLSAPPERTEFFPLPVVSKRRSVADVISQRYSSLQTDDRLPPPAIITAEAYITSATMLPDGPFMPKDLSRVPTESPPLQPPHPPYFPTPTSMSNRSQTPGKSSTSSSSNPGTALSIVVGLPIAESEFAASPLTPPPNSPLPPLPHSISTPKLISTPPTSSTPKLLPRSRSTSMSLKAPPTSSSFFDLYEQLGIWPGTDRVEEKPAEQDDSPTLGDDKVASPVRSPPEPPIVISESPSVAFSSASWEAAIGAFPVFDDFNPPDVEIFRKPSIDFALPHHGEDEESETLQEAREESTSDALSHMAVAAGSPSASTKTTLTSSTATTAASSDTARAAAGTTADTSLDWSGTYYGMPGRPSGSGGSSRNSSRDRNRHRRNSSKEGEWLGKGRNSSSESEEDLDDVPLSKLHPAALQAQQVRREEARQKREKKRAQRGRLLEKKASDCNPFNTTTAKTWDGEGGVPADLLSHKLESVLSVRGPSRTAVTSPQDTRGNYPWAAAAGTAGPSRITRDRQGYDIRQTPRAATDPLRIQTSMLSERSGRPLSAGSRGVLLTPLLPSTVPSPNTEPSATFESQLRPQPRRTGTQESVRTVQIVEPYTTRSSLSTRRPDMSRQTSASTPSPHQTHTSRLPTSSPGPSSGPGMLPDRISESRTRPLPATASNLTKQRSRALSTATSGPRHGTPDDENIVRAVTTSALCHLTYVKAFIGGLDGAKVTLELGAETTSRQILVAALERGDLQGMAAGMSWVLCEVFAERGLDRQVREYEQLQSIVKGWDGLAKFNCFVFKQSNRANPTWTRTIPQQAPFFGAFVQYEGKKGKWSKRWLETRGGQIFLAKNEKNKDEIHISTSFCDVYSMTRAYKSPKPFIFILKRIEPVSNFEDPSDYLYTFSSEESTAWRLMAAIYDAKSFDLAHTQPSLLSIPPTQNGPPALPPKSTDNANRGTRPTISASSHAAPLLSLTEKRERSAAFTGKGFLKI